MGGVGGFTSFVAGMKAIWRLPRTVGPGVGVGLGVGVGVGFGVALGVAEGDAVATALGDAAGLGPAQAT